MRRHDIDNQFHAQLMRLCNQLVKVGKRSIFGIHITIIRDIISEILLRRGKERADPDGIHPQRGNIVQTRRYARQIANSVAVGVLKGPRIDLIDDGSFPPFQPGHFYYPLPFPVPHAVKLHHSCNKQ